MIDRYVFIRSVLSQFFTGLLLSVSGLLYLVVSSVLSRSYICSYLMLSRTLLAISAQKHAVFCSNAS